MAALFRLTIHTPDSTVLDTDVISVTAPGSEGYLGVLARHAPLITSLVPGKLTVRNAEGTLDEYAVAGGFLEVADNHATLLADACEPAGAIDVSRAREAEKRARERLETREEKMDFTRFETALKRAINRIKVATDGQRR